MYDGLFITSFIFLNFTYLFLSFRLSASKASRQKYNDGFVTKWRPITTFGYRNDFEPKFQKNKRKLARMLRKEISVYKGPNKDIKTNIR